MLQSSALRLLCYAPMRCNLSWQHQTSKHPARPGVEKRRFRLKDCLWPCETLCKQSEIFTNSQIWRVTSSCCWNGPSLQGGWWRLMHLQQCASSIAKGRCPLQHRTKSACVQFMRESQGQDPPFERARLTTAKRSLGCIVLQAHFNLHPACCRLRTCSASTEVK